MGRMTVQLWSVEGRGGKQQAAPGMADFAQRSGGDARERCRGREVRFHPPNYPEAAFSDSKGEAGGKAVVGQSGSDWPAISPAERCHVDWRRWLSSLEGISSKGRGQARNGPTQTGKAERHFVPFDCSDSDRARRVFHGVLFSAIGRVEDAGVAVSGLTAPLAGLGVIYGTGVRPGCRPGVPPPPRGAAFALVVYSIPRLRPTLYLGRGTSLSKEESMPEGGNGDTQPWELIAKPQGGDTEAFDELWQRYAESVRGQAEALVFSHACRRSLAPDLVQTFWIKVWRKLPTYDPAKSAFRTWMGSVLQKHWVDYIRSTGKFEAMISVDKADEEAEGPQSPNNGHSSLDGAGINPVSDEPTPDVQAELIDHRKAIEEAVANLTPELAQAFQECFLKGKRYEEVADKLGISSRTVRRQVERVKKAILNRFKG